LGFSPNEAYWVLRAFGKTPNISHATTTGLESAGKKRLNPTVPEIIELTAKILPGNIEAKFTEHDALSSF